MHALGCAAIGIGLATALPPQASEAWFLGAGATACAAMALRGVCCRLALCAAVVLLAAGWCTLRIHETPRDFIGRAMPATGDALLHVEGVIERDAEVVRNPPGRFGSFLWFTPYSKTTLHVESREQRDGQWRSASGRIHLVVRGVADELRAGDRVRALGLAERFGPPRNHGQRDHRPTAAQRAIAGRLLCASGALVDAPAGERGVWADIGARATALTAGLRRRAAQALPEQPEAERRIGPGAEAAGAAAMRAMLLGERTDALPDVRRSFSRTGVAHMLAISGLHLGILVWVGLLLVRAGGERPRLETTLLLTALAVYLLIVRAETPVVRAAIMIGGFVIAESAERRYDRLNTLAWIGVAVLIWRPLELFSPGFQLSFGVVAGLLALARPLRDRLFGPPADPDARTALGHAKLWGADALAAGIVAWAVSAPIAAWHFGILSPFGWLATVLLTPVFALALIAGYAAMLISLAAPDLGASLAPALGALGEFVVGLVGAIDQARFTSVHLPPATPLWAAAATLVICFWLAPGQWRRPRLWFATSLLAIWTALLWTAPTLAPRMLLRIDTIDVGQGTCHLVRSGDEALLWDCGSRDLSIGEYALPRTLAALGAHRVETVILSHSDFDHYAALPDLLDPLGVRRVIISGVYEAAASRRPDGPEAALLEHMDDRGIRIETIAAGAMFPFGAAEVHVLAPGADRSFEADNDWSLVARFSVDTEAGERRLLLCGDVQREAIAVLTGSGADIRADIMEAPHHGSAIPASFAFVEEADPALVIQSTDPSRILDPRWAPVREGRTWLSTARVGAITAEIRRDGAIATDSILAGPAMVIAPARGRNVQHSVGPDLP